MQEGEKSRGFWLSTSYGAFNHILLCFESSLSLSLVSYDCFGITMRLNEEDNVVVGAIDLLLINDDRALPGDHAMQSYGRSSTLTVGKAEAEPAVLMVQMIQSKP